MHCIIFQNFSDALPGLRLLLPHSCVPEIIINKGLLHHETGIIFHPVTTDEGAEVLIIFITCELLFGG